MQGVLESEVSDDFKARYGHQMDEVAGVADADAEFIAHAREDIPALLAEVERLRVENKQLRAQLTVDDEMVERAVETHRETFNAWHVKRNLEDAENRRVAAMRAAMDAALNPYEQETK